jgi:hypothetical protein
MNIQHWSPVLIAPDRGAPSRDARCKHLFEKYSTMRLFGDVYLATSSSSANSNGTHGEIGYAQMAVYTWQEFARQSELIVKH